MSFLNTLLEKLKLRPTQARRYPLDSSRLDDIAIQSEAEMLSPESQAGAWQTSRIFHPEQPYDVAQRWTMLSQREQEVAVLICLGLTNREIAEKLFISPDTVKSHIKNIL